MVSLGLSEHCRYLSTEASELKGHPTPTNNTGSHTSVPPRGSPLTPTTSVKPAQQEPSVSIPIREVPKKESNLWAGSLILGSERVGITIKQTHTHKQVTLRQKPMAVHLRLDVAHVKTSVEIAGIQGFTVFPLPLWSGFVMWEKQRRKALLTSQNQRRMYFKLELPFWGKTE